MRSAILLCCLVEAPADRRSLAAYNIVEVDKLTANDAAAGDSFGWSVAINGDTVVVGAYGDDDGGSNKGSVYVFRTSDDGTTYNQVAKLKTADAAADHFGRAVAISGGLIAIGSATYGTGGAAYVFRTSDGGATYVEVAKLTAADTCCADNFGISVAIDGDTVVIGAYLDDDGGSDSGSAYVFRTTDGGATYGQVAKLRASDAATGDNFGGCVAIDTGTVVVGARYDDDGGANKGSVYVFRTSDDGTTYNQVAKLKTADAAADHFGRAVAISGGLIAIGSATYGTGGAAYVFRTSDGGATYVEVAKLTAADTCCADNFGISVAIDGDTVVIGAYLDDDGGSDSGSAYVFRTTDGASYGQVAKLTADDAASGDLFGISVAISKGTVVAGARYDDDAGSDSGSAYVFSLPAPTAQSTAQPTTAQPTAQPTKHIDVLDPWEIALILIACLIFCVACFVFLRPSATGWTRTKAFGAAAWTRTKAFGAAATAWTRTKALGAATTAAKISPAAPAAETPPVLRTTSVLPMGTVESVHAPDDAPSTPPILGEVVTHSTVLSVSN